MKKRKLRSYVVTTIYLVALGLMAFSITFLSQNLLEKKEMEDNLANDSIPVFGETNVEKPQVPQTDPGVATVARPFVSDTVSVAKTFYNKDESEENQENALIFYENTYMPNTGILYEADETFEIISVLDGKVKDVKVDEILGNVITIEHGSKLTTVYYTTGNVSVKVGDSVTQGSTIATSGESKLETSKKESFLFEVYLNGTLTNPENIFDKPITDFN